MMSHTAIPSESEGREEKDDAHLFLVITVVRSLYRGSIRPTPLGDLLFTWQKENGTKAACRLGSNHVFALFTKGTSDSPHQGEGPRSDA